MSRLWIFRSLTLFTITMSSAVRVEDFRRISPMRTLMSVFHPKMITWLDNVCTLLILLAGLLT